MLIVNCALRQDDIIQIVENIELENQKPFKFVRKEGIKILFESTYGDDQKAAPIVKQAIKETPLGKALYFGVSAQ